QRPRPIAMPLGTRTDRNPDRGRAVARRGELDLVAGRGAVGDGEGVLWRRLPELDLQPAKAAPSGARGWLQLGARPVLGGRLHVQINPTADPVRGRPRAEEVAGVTPVALVIGQEL